MNQQLIVILQSLKIAAIHIREVKIDILGHENIPYHQCHSISKIKLCLRDISYTTNQEKYVACQNCPMSAGLYGYSNTLLKMRWV